MVSKWINPIINVRHVRQSIGAYRRYIRNWRAYARMPGAEPLHLGDAYPILHDWIRSTPFESHYFYQDLWALKKIQASQTQLHVDIGSNVVYVGMLTAFTKVIFIDIRPLNVNIDNYQSLDSSILALPFGDNSLDSISCLHVAEHIGLGRYGDPIDPSGTRKAAAELARILRPGGHLYFSLPVGRARVCYNAHRIHTPQQIMDYFQTLTLQEFAAVDDNGKFLPLARPVDFNTARYACGLFHFTKETR